MLSILIFLALVIGALWLYNRFFGGCGCADKKV
jgi:hypothetical protein